MNPRLMYDEADTLPVNNDFRQVSLIIDPIVKVDDSIANGPVYSQSMTVTTVGSGNYNDDEWAYQGTNLDKATFRGKVVKWDSVTGELLLINTKGYPSASTLLLGLSSATARVVASVSEAPLKKNSGSVLYVNNA
jgi:hypothetical protein